MGIGLAGDLTAEDDASRCTGRPREWYSSSIPSSDSDQPKPWATRPSWVGCSCRVAITPGSRHPIPPLGLGVGRPEIATAALEPADRVLFYTDGVVEGRNLAGEPFGEARLADLLVRETLAGQLV